MKNFSRFILLLISITGFSQTYKFNLLTDYVTSGNNDNGFYQYHAVSYSNTDNDRYYLFVNKFSYKNFAYIRDSKTGKCHHLKFTESKEGNETFFEFQFDTTMTHQHHKSIYPYSVSIISEDSTSQKIKISWYLNERRKRKNKPLRQEEITVVAAENNMFPLYQRLFLDDRDLILAKKVSGVVKSVISRGKNPWSRRLVYAKKLDFSITIPGTNNSKKLNRKL